MPLTTIDPTPALIVVDLQKGITGRVTDTAHPVEGVLANSASLARAFREHGYPVVLVTATGIAPGRTDRSGGAGGGARSFPPDFAKLADELDAQDSDHRVVKQTWGAFTDTQLDALLKADGVTQVFLVGIATSAGVESTARFAHELGYHVVLATDAMTDRSAEAHDASVRLTFPKLGETATTAEILTALG